MLSPKPRRLDALYRGTKVIPERLGTGRSPGVSPPSCTTFTVRGARRRSLREPGGQPGARRGWRTALQRPPLESLAPRGGSWRGSTQQILRVAGLWNTGQQVQRITSEGLAQFCPGRPPKGQGIICNTSVYTISS